MLKVMVTHDDFREVLAETQVRNPEHLRLDTQFIIYSRHAAVFTIYTKKITLSDRARLYTMVKHLSLAHNIGRAASIIHA